MTTPSVMEPRPPVKPLSPILQTLKNIDGGLVKVERVLLFTLLMSMVFLIFGEVLKRYFLFSLLDLKKMDQTSLFFKVMNGWATFSATEWARLFMVWSGFIGASVATQESKHLAITFPYPEKARKWIFLSRFLVAFAICCAIAVLGWAAWLFKIKVRTSGSAYDTSWLYLSIPVCFTIMSLRSLLLAARGWVGDFEDPEPEH